MKRSNAQSATGDVAADIADIADIADAAVTTVAATGRLSFRVASGMVRLVVRRPREVLTGVVIVVALVSVLSYLRSRSETAGATT